MTDRQCEPVLGRILLYVHDIEGVAEFYAFHFGFRILQEEGDRIVELESPGGAGNNIMLHPLGRGRKSGQTVAKLVFDISDVTAFCARAAKQGLEFGPMHKGDGYVFANAKDPAGNSISVSSRAFRHGREAAVDNAAAGPRQTDLQEVIMAAGVPTLTHAQLRQGYDAALAETGVRLDVQAVHDAWLRQVAAKKTPPRKPLGHWIDFCRRRAQEVRA